MLLREIVKNELTADEVKEFADKVRDELGLTRLDLYLRSNGDLNVNTIIVPKEIRKTGVGTKAMERIIEFAKKHGLRITLTAAVRDDFHGTTSHSRLVKFYKKLGFVDNKGRNKDFRISDGMYKV